MNIDERLEKLTERHEALTATVELHDKRMADVEEKLRHRAVVAEQNEVRAGQMMDLFNRLGRIIQIHEQRIDTLGGRCPA
jgi:hypothetical protein